MELETGEIVPRDYQWEAYHATANHIRKYTGPAFVEASVGAGKTIMIGMVCKRCQDAGLSALVLARQGELVDQNAKEMWRLGVKNSVYSASLGSKSTAYPIIVGTEGTVARALDGKLSGFRPDIILIDECHQMPYDEPGSQYMQIIAELQRRNPKVRIIGYTGSPYRGVEPIKGQFWKAQLTNIDTKWLIDRGFLVPMLFGFGHDDVGYDLSEFKPANEHGTADFSLEQMRQMERKILKEKTTTQKIMREVMELAKTRNGVMITCAGKKHCEEAASELPPGSYGIVTDATPKKERADILAGAVEGRIKYVFQIGCLTTGVNVPLWDTIVILRRIGSLTLLTQLLGRGLRQLRPQELDAGFAKSDCMVLDYSGTMHEMGELYYNPILEQAEEQRAKKVGDVITCPKCYTENSMFARRCIADDSTAIDGRCEHFWQSRPCHACGTENDIAARECRKCHQQLIDPNANLTRKHYTDDDLQPVLGFDMRLTSNGEGVLVEYQLEGDKATEVFWPGSTNPGARNAWKMKFVLRHVRDRNWQRKALSMRNAVQVIGAKAMFDAPVQITHRRNDKGKSIVHRKVFSSGREENLDHEPQNTDL